jgi:hypothetical protein
MGVQRSNRAGERNSVFSRNSMAGGALVKRGLEECRDRSPK